MVHDVDNLLYNSKEVKDEQETLVLYAQAMRKHEWMDNDCDISRCRNKRCSSSSYDSITSKPSDRSNHQSHQAETKMRTGAWLQ